MLISKAYIEQLKRIELKAVFQNPLVKFLLLGIYNLSC